MLFAHFSKNQRTWTSGLLLRHGPGQGHGWRTDYYAFLPCRHGQAGFCWVIVPTLGDDAICLRCSAGGAPAVPGARIGPERLREATAFMTAEIEKPSAAGRGWQLAPDDLQASLVLPSIGCTLPLADVYERFP
jgi:hypothetical protein